MKRIVLQGEGKKYRPWIVGNHGAWGLAEYYDSRPADYPKLDATLHWAKQHGQLVDLSGS